jgi:hypothetical protein
MKDSYDDMNFTPPSLSRITAATLIVCGDRDPLYPIEMALRCIVRFPGPPFGSCQTEATVPFFWTLRLSSLKRCSRSFERERFPNRDRGYLSQFA